MLSLTDRFAFFMRESSVEGMNAGEQLVYFNLLWLNNVLRWKEWFTCSDRQLQELTTIKNKQAITSAKNSLKQKGWIDFRKKDKSTTLYKMTCPEYTVKNRADDRADDRALSRLDKTRLDKTKNAAAGAGEDDDSLAKVVRCFESNIHPLTGKIERDRLIDLTEEYSPLWVKTAIEEAALSNGRNLRYITAILERWKREGFKTPRKGVKSSGTSRDNSRAALEARYPDFVEADRNHVYPWEVQSPGGGDRAASG